MPNRPAKSKQGLRAEREKVLSPKDRAQDLVWQAWEEPSDVKARVLVRRALKLDPDCVDALVLRAQMQHLTDSQYRSALEAAVAAGERSLGAAFFTANRGFFWGLLETRPYMRARKELASVLLAGDHVQQARTHLEALLDLNPDDNQGVRYELVALYLSRSELDAAENLLSHYPENSMVFALARSFLSVLRSERAAMPLFRKLLRDIPPLREVLLHPVRILDAIERDGYIANSIEEAEFAFMTLLPVLTAHEGLNTALLEACLPPPGRNARCDCGSGIKYKHCCGKF